MPDGAAEAGQGGYPPLREDARFRWHPEARLFGPDGREHRPGSVPPLAVIPERPTPQALIAAFAASEAGIAFRIGGPPDAPEPGLAFETLTGGTTGTPRRICRSHASWIASFTVNAGLFSIGPGTAVAILGSLAHSLPLYAGMEALHLGASLHCLGSLSPARQITALTSRGVNILYATPAQLHLLTAARAAPNPVLRQIIIGGGAPGEGLTAALRTRFPAALIHSFYGTAETSFITLRTPDMAPGVAGKPYPGVTIRITDDQGRPAPEGLVHIQSPYLAQGYAGPAKGEALWQHDGVTLDDCGRMAAGLLILKGRASRRIRIADQSVFPEEIEGFLMTLPGVTHATAIARPDPARGHVIEAVLTGDPARTEAILRAARITLGPLAAPRRLHWRQDWPLLPSGKPDLARLEADLPW